MGSKIEIHLATVDEKLVEGIVKDIVEFLKQYTISQQVAYVELHKRYVIK